MAVIACCIGAAGDKSISPESKTKAWFNAQLDTLQQQLGVFSRQTDDASQDSLQNSFAQCRLRYKRIEAFVEYYYPAAANKINGAPLLEAEASDPEEPQHPSGFQVLEPILYEEADQKNRLIMRNELSSISRQVQKVKVYNTELDMTAAQVLDLLRLNMYRLIAKGISGFDCPVTLASVPEAIATIEAAIDVLHFYGASMAVVNMGRNAIVFLKKPYVSFNDFDRAVFLTDYLNPFLNELHQWQEASGIAYVSTPRAVRPAAAGIFVKDAFDPYFFAPSGTAKATLQLAALGRKLFYDPVISGNGGRSCGSCHDPGKAFTDGLRVNHTLSSGEQLQRNTPTLINAALQPVQFADSRISFLEDQVHDVISNEQEMNGDFRKIIRHIGTSDEYKTLFTAAFPFGTKGWSKAIVRTALAAYIRSLVALNAPFDQYMRGAKTAMNEEEIYGFNLFMGKAKCGTCHYAPLFSGAVPPLYEKMESEVIGVPATTDTVHPLLDSDEGKYERYKMPHQHHSFKTTGLRNCALTAPYMHNGVYATLEEVLNFYNQGGGSGLKLDVPNQTLAPDRLELSAPEKHAVIAFLKTLTDTTVAGQVYNGKTSMK